MTRKCIRGVQINGLIFIPGCYYEVSYNNYDGRIYIYDWRGAFTDILKSTLDMYFL